MRKTISVLLLALFSSASFAADLSSSVLTCGVYIPGQPVGRLEVSVVAKTGNLNSLQPGDVVKMITSFGIVPFAARAQGQAAEDNYVRFEFKNDFNIHIELWARKDNLGCVLYRN